VLQRLYDKNRSSDDGPGSFEEAMVIDPETTPLLVKVTHEGRRIGASDEINFEYGLDCILDHAARLIEQQSATATTPAAQRRKPIKAAAPRRTGASAR
jgi:hypothetical protein